MAYAIYRKSGDEDQDELVGFVKNKDKDTVLNKLNNDWKARDDMKLSNLMTQRSNIQSKLDKLKNERPRIKLSDLPEAFRKQFLMIQNLSDIEYNRRLEEHRKNLEDVNKRINSFVDISTGKPYYAVYGKVLH